MSTHDPLAAFRAAEPPYLHALEELAALRYARDQALLDAHRAGLEEEALSAATGLELAELQAALARARAAESADLAAPPELPRGVPPAAITLTALYEPDERGWVRARLLEWPAVITCGRSREEAGARLRDAVCEWLLGVGDDGGAVRAAGRAEREPLELVVGFPGSGMP